MLHTGSHPHHPIKTVIIDVTWVTWYLTLSLSYLSCSPSLPLLLSSANVLKYSLPPSSMTLLSSTPPFSFVSGLSSSAELLNIGMVQERGIIFCSWYLFVNSHKGIGGSMVFIDLGTGQPLRVSLSSHMRWEICAKLRKVLSECWHCSDAGIMGCTSETQIQHLACSWRKKNSDIYVETMQSQE